MKTTAEVCAAIGGAAEMFGNEETGRLICAAPDLLRALKQMLERSSSEYWPVEQEMARAAIAKAEGQS